MLADPALLLEIEAIRQLKYRYLRHLDCKEWDDFAACFVAEATADYGGLAFDSRRAIVDYMRTNVGPGVVTLHQAHHPEITVAADRARGRWYLEDRVLVPEHRFVLEGAAFYTDDYVRTDDGWRILRTSYVRTYEATWSTDDVPSFKVARPQQPPATSPTSSM